MISSLLCVTQVTLVDCLFSTGSLSEEAERRRERKSRGRGDAGPPGSAAMSSLSVASGPSVEPWSCTPESWLCGLLRGSTPTLFMPLLPPSVFWKKMWVSFWGGPSDLIWLESVVLWCGVRVSHWEHWWGFSGFSTSNPSRVYLKIKPLIFLAFFLYIGLENQFLLDKKSLALIYEFDNIEDPTDE